MPIRNCSTTSTAPPPSVAEKLKAFGCDEVVTGVGRTGVVGVIRGRKKRESGAPSRTIGLRADMDALPIYGGERPAVQVDRPGQDARLRP